MRLINFPQKIIEYSYYLLFFLVPLFLTPVNYELFEYNKMMLTYALTIIIVGSWMIKMILNKKIIFSRTPLDLLILLFLLSQIISTIFSIDRHVSIWGYYSRFNGGLLSTISYILLYYAFVNNFPKNKIKKLLYFALASGVIVATYGILERLGIDKDLWVQDVQNRVFSTLGQPNWLAAYLAVLIPVAIGLHNSPSPPLTVRGGWGALLGLWTLSSLFYITLLFTKSRSGFIGFWIANAVFWLILLIKYKKCILRYLLIFNFSFLIFNFIFGSPFPQLNLLTTYNPQPTTKSSGSSIIDVGITESGKIRELVWKGAINIAKNYPFFGTGVETFAFAYYKFRPVEHNATSEWDFLYNKAHNEYLNFLATTGFIGLGTYLLLIGSFIWWNLKKLKTQNSLHFALFSAWLSILVTNFFGFSVVMIQLFFYLIPAVSFVLIKSDNEAMRQSSNVVINKFQKAIFLIILLSIFYFLFSIAKMWYADLFFAAGYNASQSQEYTTAYENFRQAILLNDNEAFYYNEFSLPAAQIAAALDEEKESTASSALVQEATLASDTAITSSPNNVNFWKTRTRVFYALSAIDEKYLADAQDALEKARLLSPTDPKIVYNLAVIYDKMGKREEAMKLLDATTKLKTDYRDAYFAMGLFYERDKKFEEAKKQYEFILNRINPNDEEAKKKMEALGNRQ